MATRKFKHMSLGALPLSLLFAMATACGGGSSGGNDSGGDSDDDDVSSGDGDTKSVSDSGDTSEGGDEQSSGGDEDSGTPAEPGAASKAYPDGFAIASPTAPQSTTQSKDSDPSSAPNGRLAHNGAKAQILSAKVFAGKNYAEKEAEISAMLSATKAEDCDVQFQQFLGGLGSPNCYGPNLDYKSHPDAKEGQMDSGQLPGGDLGIWDETFGEDGEACAAAKLNQLVDDVGLKVDTALYSAANMICLMNVGGVDLPEIGSEVDMTSEVAASIQNTNPSLTVNSAKIAREEDDESGRAVYLYTFDIDSEGGGGGEMPPPMDGGEMPPPMDGGEMPPPEEGGEPPKEEGGEPPPIEEDMAETGTGGEMPPPEEGGEPPKEDGGEMPPPMDGGEMPPPMDGGEMPPPMDGGPDGGHDGGGGGDGGPSNVTINLRHAVNADDPSNYEGMVWSFIDNSPGFGDAYGYSASYKRDAEGIKSRVLGAAFPKNPTEIFDEDNLIDFGGDWNGNGTQGIFNIDPETGSSKVSFAWQAGTGDSHTRTFNAWADIDKEGGSGCGFFGYGPRFDNTSGEITDNTISTFICNWAGPSNNHTGLEGHAQKQCMETNEDGVFAPTESAISYAPTNDCDSTEDAEFEYKTSADDEFSLEPLPNELVELASDPDYADWEAPSFP